MIHGSMVEASQGFATLEDVDLDTFLRFVQWLYHGYYDAARPGSLESLETYQTPTRTVDDGLCGNCRYHRRIPYAASFQKKESFLQRDYIVRNVKKDAPKPRPNSSPQEEYSEVFLGHARVYVFADKYDIQTLKVLAMEELHAALAVYTLYEERTGDIVALLRFVYGHTADSKDGVEDLRTILTEYMEMEIDTLIKDEELQELMIQDGGPLLAQLMKAMRKKLA